MCDPVVPMLGADPSTCDEWYCVYGEVENEGPCRGAMKIDWVNLRKKTPNLIIVAKLNKKKVY